MTAHMIFDVKLNAVLNWKTIYVSDGHKVDTPLSMTYYLVISIYSVHILLMLADINGLDVKCTDVQNEYINANPKNRVWFWDRKEFGVHKDKVVFVVRELYGVKGAVSEWASTIRQLMRDFELITCRDDGYIWMRKAADTKNIGATTNAGLPSG